jgi:hypothetical protein
VTGTRGCACLPPDAGGNFDLSTELFDKQLQAAAPAVHVLTDTVADYLLTRGHGAKIGEIASQAGRRLGASAKLIRQVLSTDPSFVGEERRWNLALRTLTHRPVEGALRTALRLYGKPMSSEALSNELATLNNRPADFFAGFLNTFLSNRPQTYFRTRDGRWALREWLFEPVGETEADVLTRNFFLAEDEMKPLLTKAAKAKVTATSGNVEAALLVLKKLGAPTATKVLAWPLWLAQQEAFDAEGFYLDLVSDTRMLHLSGGEWMAAEGLSAASATLTQLSLLAEEAVEEEETWEGPYVATGDDLTEVIDHMIESGGPMRLSEIIETVLEYSPASSRYPSIYEGLTTALAADGRFQLVGQQTWTIPSLIPQEVMRVPDSLLPETLDPTLLTDPETDAELTDEGLEGNLPTWVHDPRYEDFGGEHEVELSPELISGAGTVDETRVPVLFDHRSMGTLKLRQADMVFFPTDTPQACVAVRSDDGTTFRMWLNNEELLIHGLADWYETHQIPVGAVLTFRRGSEADEYEISWDGEMDELIVMDEERINALLDLRDPAEENNWSVYEVMRNVLAGHGPTGAHFLTLWAEVNVVRRTGKRVVASNLSSYHCFVPVTNTERWRLDERKVDQGRKKTKKKFVVE